MKKENEINSPYTYLDELSSMVPEIPADSIVSRTLFTDEKVKVVLFGFAPGQELSEHTASHPAVLHFLQGEARLTLGEESHEAKEGTWTHMAPNLSHSVHAITEVKMLLTLLRN
jgi:quercetin dioxygenase-like cupin family protein